MNEQAVRLLLSSIHDVQRLSLEEASRGELFDLLLDRLLLLTESEYGFVGEVLRRDDGAPYLDTHAITEIARDGETRALYEERATEGLQFSNLDALFGAAIRSGQRVIDNDPRRGGTPDGHPPLEAFLGLPLFRGEELIGMVGVANREGGYDEELADYLEPFLATCAQLISSHRNAAARRAAQAALVARESSLGRLFEANIVGMMVADTNGRILRANQYFLDMVGYGEEDLPIRWDLMTPPEWRHTDEEAIRRLAEDGIAPSWEKEYVHRDGHRVPILVGVALLEGSRDEVVGFVLDLSERRKLEAEQEALREQLRRSQRLEAAGTVAAGMAHDFNNLLTVIRGWAENARLGTPRGTRADRALAEIEVAITRGVDLTRTMLSFSGRSRARTAELELGAFLQDSRRMLESMLPASIELVIATPDAPLWLAASPTELQQIVINLAINARDAMPGGGTLALRADGTDSEVRLECRDTGGGMTEEIQERAFDPFFSTKSRGSGTGLGLSLVHGIVQGYGGSVTVRSEPGEGTRFAVTLPAIPGPDAADPPDSGKIPRGNGEIVLVAEDDPRVRAVIAETLEHLGYEPLEAPDGEAALEALARHGARIRLAVLDVDMPKLDGLACLDAIRSRDRELPVIVTSGFHISSLSERGDPRLVSMPKPVGMDDLARQIDRFLSETSVRA